MYYLFLFSYVFPECLQAFLRKPVVSEQDLQVKNCHLQAKEPDDPAQDPPHLQMSGLPPEDPYPERERAHRDSMSEVQFDIYKEQLEE